MPKTSVEKHFDKIADKYDFYTEKRSLHYSNLKKLLESLIPKGQKVFEVGCGTGDLLAYLRPERGYGMDISSAMIEIAKKKYNSKKSLTFSTKWPFGYFDYVFMSDVIEHLEKPQETFSKILNLMGSKSVFICTMMNRVWIPVEAVYNFFGWKMPEGPHNRVKNDELRIIMEKSGMQIVKHDYKLLMPIRIPILTNFLNKYLEKPLRRFAFIEYFVATRA